MSEVVEKLRILQEQGLFKSLLTLTSVEIARDNTSVEIRQLYANALYHEKMYVLAAEQYQILLGASHLMQAELLTISKRLYKCKLQLKKHEEAIQCLQSVLQLHPGKCNSWVHSRMAALWETLGNRERAVECWHAVLKETPHATEAVEALSRLGTPGKELVQFYKKEEKKRKQTSSEWLNPFLQRVVRLLAYLRVQNGPKALEEIKGLEATVGGPSNAQILMWKGRALLYADRVDHACQCFAQLRLEHPRWRRGMFWAGLAFAQGGRRKQLLQLAADFKDDQLVAWYYLTFDEPAGALRFITKHMETCQDADAWALLGRCFIACGNAQTASRAFNKALQLDSMHSVALEGLVKNFLDHNNVREAVKTSKAAFRVDPTSPQLMALFGSVLAHVPDVRERAGDMLLKALKAGATSIAGPALVKLLCSEGEVNRALGFCAVMLGEEMVDDEERLPEEEDIPTTVAPIAIRKLYGEVLLQAARETVSSDLARATSYSERAAAQFENLQGKVADSYVREKVLLSYAVINSGPEEEEEDARPDLDSAELEDYERRMDHMPDDDEDDIDDMMDSSEA